MTYCTSCGLPIPDGQGSSCSMCYGDIGHGTDGYYEQWAQEEIERERQKAEDEIVGCLICGNPDIGGGRYCLECLKTIVTTNDF